MQVITRRNFLKLGAASTALLALETKLHPIAQAVELVNGGRSVNRTSGLPRSFLPSTCTQCEAGCGIMGYVEESRLVKIGGNVKHISNGSSLCARGQAGINALYDPNRILQPLRRRGSRGENANWVPMSWDDAATEISEQMKAIKGNPDQFVYLTDDLQNDALGRRFTHAFGSSNAIGAAGVYDANKRVATQLTWGQAGDMPDVANTKYILAFGANPMENHPQFVGFVQRLVRGMRSNQAKLTVFDVRLNNTSALANEFLYVNPGTYGLVALSMANVIMQEGLFDRGFIEAWTNVSPEDLAQHLAQYTPERAQAEAGVSAAVIRRIATEFATTKPATTLSDKVASSHGNGTQTERAIMLLNVITGNIDSRGGLCLPRQYDIADADPAPKAPNPSNLAHPGDLPLASFQSVGRSMAMLKDAKLGVLMTHGFNPVYSSPDGSLIAETLKNETAIPYHIAVTPFMTETAALADIILPETTYLEDWAVEVRPSPELVPFVALRQPVVPPLESSISFFDIATRIAKQVGGGMETYFAFNSVEDYLKARVGKIGGLAAAGGLDYLKQHGVWYDPKSKPNYGSYQAGGFNTPSGKIEVSSRLLGDNKFPAMPTYEPVAAFGKMEDRELVLNIYDTAVQNDAKTANCMWLDEILHDNPLWMNPETAGELGIQEGDKVKVLRSSKSGEAKERSIETTAFLSEGVHPKVVALAIGVGHSVPGEYAAISQGEKIDRDKPERVLQDPNTELVWWGEKDGIGVNPKQIVPVATDPVGGGQAWGDMVVTVAKI